jgi:predicted GNAT family acetyltransferase
MQHEAQNAIPLGNVIMGKLGKDKTEWRDPAKWYMATVQNENGVQLTALMTPPKGLTLYATDNKINKDAINCLLNEPGKIHIPSVMCINELAYSFADAYCAANNMFHEVKDNMRLYELSQVNPDVPQIGTVRLAEERDMSFLPYWVEAFQICFNKQGITMNEPQDGEIFRHLISLKNRYILEVDGVPVSLAAITRELQTSCNIASVYTPPYFRGKGYAASCVAQVSQIILDRGFAKSIITTDLSNPTSNSIYQKIGYTPLCDSVMLKFNPKE